MHARNELAIRRCGVFPILALGLCVVGCGGDSTGPTDPTSSHSVPCLSASSACGEQVLLGTGHRLPVFRTHPIQDGDSTVVRAVIVVHGADRNPDAYFERMVEAVRLSGLTPNTLVIAPRFQTEDDNPGANEPTWTESGWKKGHKSISAVGGGERISSYETVDDVLGFLGNRSLFPKLEKVVVTGHSAGGQYAHRFAATSPAAEELPHLRFRYVVINPSTYLYLGPERAVAGGGFEIPNWELCTDYNAWHYGFEDRNSYALRLTEAETRSRLIGRDLVYMVGSADTGEASLDMSCGAMLQGMHRYARGLTLFNYMESHYPEANQQLLIVEGVGHSSTLMFQSILGRQALFEW
ncbi:MAG: hypothetical protein ABIF09_02960 [Gemmatimonadota bacterium]